MDSAVNVLANAVALALEDEKLDLLPPLTSIAAAADPLQRANFAAVNTEIIGAALGSYSSRRTFRKCPQLAHQRALLPVSMLSLLIVLLCRTH